MLLRLLFFSILTLCSGFASTSATADTCQSYFFLDKTARLSPNDLASLPKERWTSYRLATPGYGFSRAALWIKLSCEKISGSERERIVSFDYPLLDELKHFTMDEGRLVFQGVSGDLTPIKGSALSSRHPSFSLQLKNTSTEHYFRISTLGSLQAPITITSPREHALLQRTDYLVLGCYYGLMAAVFLYNLLIFVTCFDKIFLVYSVFILSYFNFQMSANGFWSHFFEFFWLQNQGLSLAMFASEAMIIVFAVTFLRSQGLPAKLVKPLWVSALLVLLTGFLSIFVSYQHTAPIAAIGGTLIPTLVLIGSIILSKNGSRSARVFMGAWFFYLAGTICLAIKNLGIIAPSMLSNNAIQIGSAIEMILLAVALGMRFRDLELAQKIQMQKSMSRELVAQKNEMVANMATMLSHDMRAPLGVFERLLSSSSLKLLEAEKCSIREALARLHAMIESLRFNESESLVKAKLVSLDLSMGILSLQAKAEKNGIVIYYPRQLILHLFIDATKFERAWVNLASNALDFAKTEIRIEVECHDKDLILRVLDDGPGVAEDFLPRLFQRGATQGKNDGTGLGLAYVRQIMRGHGGDISYRRQHGQTIFECRIPNAVVENIGPRKFRELTRQDEAVDLAPKKVAICTVPKSLGDPILAHLPQMVTKRFQFTGDYQSADVIISNDLDLLLRAIEDGKDPVELKSALPIDKILARLSYRFA